MTMIRPAAVAGQFYPADPAILQDSVRELMRHGHSRAARLQLTAPPKALVVPHAGYIYSGALAAEAYALLEPVRDRISRVVLLGPSHRVGFEGIALSSAEVFRTPLGDIPLDQGALQELTDLPAVNYLDAAHEREHSLEVQLPLLQEALGDFQLLPLVIGQATAETVARVLEHAWGDVETLIVISTDLSHFHDYDTARRLDAGAAQLIENRQPVLSGEQACGCRGLNGLLQLLAEKSLPIQRLGLLNSGDTAGDRQRVVGYGAWWVTESQ